MPQAAKPHTTIPRFYITTYTDGPWTWFNVVDRKSMELLRRFGSEAEAKAFVERLIARYRPILSASERGEG